MALLKHSLLTAGLVAAYRQMQPVHATESSQLDQIAEQSEQADPSHSLAEAFTTDANLQPPCSSESGDPSLLQQSGSSQADKESVVGQDSGEEAGGVLHCCSPGHSVIQGRSCSAVAWLC